MRKGLLALYLAIVATCGAGIDLEASERYITVASTTSTANSGFFDSILPVFESKTGIEVRVVAVGTGQALRLARNGDADVLFVHHRPSEEAFVREGYGLARHDVMFNDFVVVGPAADPAEIRGLTGAGAAFERLAAAKAAFVSRGDDSGTHKMEIGIWNALGRAPWEQSGAWYRELGAGMGRTLNTAAALDAYALTDRGTWLGFANKGNLEVLVEGDPALHNPYGVVLLDPARFPHIKAQEGQAFVDWLLSRDGQTAIAAFKVGEQQLFFPAAVQ